MKVWLIDLDGKMENLALMRLSAWHKQRGDTVVLKRCANRRGVDFSQALPPLWGTPDKVYVSCIFRWHEQQAIQFQSLWNGRATLGGTGIDIETKLPPEIADEPVDYSLYGRQRVVGFITRGCNNRCPWCVVWRKEGQLHRVATAQELLQANPEATEAIFLDNNILQLQSDCLPDLAFLADAGIPIDFNQGLDAKFVTHEVAEHLAACKWVYGPRLALDSDSRTEIVKQAVHRLERAGIPSSKITVFVLIGYSGFQSDRDRLLTIRELGCNAFPMGYRDLLTGEEPANGWDRKLYQKYRRLIIRLPQAKSVWRDFRNAEMAI